MEKKLAHWIGDAMGYLDQDGMQEAIFDIPELLESESLEDIRENVKKLCHHFLKLSFILKRHKEEIVKLIEYWDNGRL